MHLGRSPGTPRATRNTRHARLVGRRATRATLLDRIVPARALRWGRLTAVWPWADRPNPAAAWGAHERTLAAVWDEQERRWRTEA